MLETLVIFRGKDGVIDGMRKSMKCCLQIGVRQEFGGGGPAWYLTCLWKDAVGTRLINV